MALTKIDDRGLKTPIDLLDNEKIRFGTGDDLQIYHDGSNSYIDHQGSGNLFIRGNGTNNVHLRAKIGESSVKCVPDGAVELYYDNSKKFQTNPNGIHFSAAHTFMDDNYRARFGNGDDLQIYHDGNVNTILSMNGALYLKGDASNVVGIQPRNGENAALFFPDGAVQLYYDNSLKLNTNSTGIGITGNITPVTNDTYNLGSSSYKWDNVYATNGTIQTSDRNEKNNIVQSDLGLSFIDQLKPVSYKFNNKDKTHYGLIAQDLEKVLEKEGKTLDDFAGIIKDETYGLNYSELISPLIKAVQELSAKVAALESS